MPSWEVWNSFDSEAFLLLKYLQICDCPKLKGDLPNDLPALETLTVTNCELIDSSLPRTSVLRILQIMGSNKVGVHESVECIQVKGSPMVKSMIEAITNVPPTCLHSLILCGSSSAISFPDGRLPASLKTLDIIRLPKLEFPMQHKHESLAKLSISSSCDSLTSLPLGTFPNLQSLLISYSENMEPLSVSGLESYKSLSSLEISQCPNFVSFLRKGLHAPNLISFKVDECNKLKTFPAHMSTLLPKLEYLDISNFPEIESFPGGGMPPYLTTVSIINCDKLLSSQSWPSMDKLTSLYIGGSCDGIKSFPKGGLLPPSLTDLQLSNLSSLEALDCKELLHLTSLQKLQISFCKKLENIEGERLPVSLIKLIINECPLLGK